MTLQETKDEHIHNTIPGTLVDSSRAGSPIADVISDETIPAVPVEETVIEHQESGICFAISNTCLALGAWSRGEGHKKARLPCQDRIGVRAIGYDVMIGAACDGAGSAPRSDQGATLCVETVLNELESSVRVFFALNRDNAVPAPSFLDDVKHRVHRAVNAAIDQEAFIVGSRRREYATTLVAYVVTPAWLLILQVGDSFVVYRTSESPNQYCLAGEPAKGEYANETTFITDIDSCDAIQGVIVGSRPDFVAASTDGLATLMLNLSDWTPHDRVFEQLEKFSRNSITSSGGSEDVLVKTCDELAAWLASPDVVKRTDDDKSLLLAVARIETGGSP